MSWQSADGVRHAVGTEVRNLSIETLEVKETTARASSCGVDLLRATRTDQPVDCMTCLVKMTTWTP